MNLTYSDAGVSVERGDLFVERIKSKVKRTYNNRVSSGVGGFACLYDMGDKFLSAGTDGVGTKVLIAQQMNKHDTIGIDLVAMCVNDIICTGAKPQFFMDYLASGKLDLEVSEAIVEGVVEGCLQSECALIGGETAEMPGLYQEGDYDLAGFAVGEVAKERVITGNDIEEGDLLYCLPSNGFHSNGYSLLRKVFDTNDHAIGNFLLRPTRIYVKDLFSILNHVHVKGVSHITGGGIDNISRMNKNFDYQYHPLDKKYWVNGYADITRDMPIDELEMYKTFNMGVGLVFCVSSKDRLKIENIADQFGIYECGKVSTGSGNVILY
ncbi:MAG: phosphoribosylformylglycinamidine cyclo-ligase [Oligoflexia bacterium]|nr:phosphoribosylformylglycinamidine cyclo-ligase [Oligoflexia bacterium]